MPIDQKQVEEWAESPVTDHLVALLRKKLDAVFRHRGEIFISGEPIKTQEIRANLIGQESVLDEIVQAIESKDLNELEEADDGEQVGHSPVRRSHSGEA